MSNELVPYEERELGLTPLSAVDAAEACVRAMAVRMEMMGAVRKHMIQTTKAEHWTTYSDGQGKSKPWLTWHGAMRILDAAGCSVKQISRERIEDGPDWIWEVTVEVSYRDASGQKHSVEATGYGPSDHPIAGSKHKSRLTRIAHTARFAYTRATHLAVLTLFGVGGVDMESLRAAGIKPEEVTMARGSKGGKAAEEASNA